MLTWPLLLLKILNYPFIPNLIKKPTSKLGDLLT